MDTLLFCPEKYSFNSLIESAHVYEMDVIVSANVWVSLVESDF